MYKRENLKNLKTVCELGCRLFVCGFKIVLQLVIPLNVDVSVTASSRDRFGIESILQMQARHGVMQEESAHSH